MIKKYVISVLCLVVLVFPLFLQVDFVSASSDDDWSMFRNDLNHSGNSATAPATSNSLLWKLDAGVPLGSSAAIVDGKVYVASNDGSVYCLNAADGSQIWKSSLNHPAAISSVIAVANGYLYFGCYDKNVYCLDALTGKAVWSYATGNSVQSSPSVVSGRVYVGSWDANVYCLDAVSGDKIWNYTTGALVDSSQQ